MGVLMDDRIAEIREALRQWDAGELLQSDIARLAAAARAYADLLESETYPMLWLHLPEERFWKKWMIE